MYILIDLERSIGGPGKIGYTNYWKAHGRGYTIDIREAGFYTEEIAAMKVQEDIDKRTVMVHVDTVKRLLKV